ncbi:gamma-glutamylcyclotransferase family protein [Thermovibrio sp.]
MRELVFVYGTLKRGFWNNALLKRARFIGKGITLEKFKLYTVGFPYAVPDEEGLPLKGEVYEVDEKTLLELDNLEGYPIHYKRKRVKVKLNTRKEVEALMYYRKEPRGTPVPPKGKFFVWEGE